MSHVAFRGRDYHGDYARSAREIYGLTVGDFAVVRWEHQIVGDLSPRAQAIGCDEPGITVWSVTEGSSTLYVRFERATARVIEVVTPEYAAAIALRCMGGAA